MVSNPAMLAGQVCISYNICSFSGSHRIKIIIEEGAVATVAAGVDQSRRLARPFPGRRHEHVFFSVTAVLMLGTVLVGFACSYYLAGVFHQPLPGPLVIHGHAVAFTCWIFLLVAQTSLASARRLDIQRMLGMAGFLLACLMVVLGVWAATESLAHPVRLLGRDGKAFYIMPLSSMLMFAVLTFFAFRCRSDPTAHKRLIRLATCSLLVAAIARWPWPVVERKVDIATLVSFAFLLLLLAYDLWSMRRIHSATLWGSAFLVFVSLIRFPISRTTAWHDFATWILDLVT